jgi:predicted nucleic acid-binding protein
MADALAAGAHFIAPWLLLLEVAGALSRRSGDPTMASQAVRFMLQTGSLHLLVPDRDLWSLAADSAAELGLRGADALYVATARQLDQPLVTLDRDQARRAATVIEVVEPGQGP